MTQEALKLALEALKEYVNVVVSVNDPNEWTPKVADAGEPARKAITAIKEALRENAMREVQRLGQEIEQEPVVLEAVYETIIQWDEGGGKRSRRELARRIVALYTTPPQQEPVAYWKEHAQGLQRDYDSLLADFQAQRSESSGKPSAWVGLTDEERTEIRLSQERDDIRTSEMLRKVEAKLKEKNT